MKKVVFFLFLSLKIGWFLLAQYPIITRLDTKDDIFKQYLSNVETARKQVFSQQRLVEPEVITKALTIYTYTPLATDDLYSIAARCIIPPSSLASLNHIAHPGGLGSHGAILLPSIPGLFVPLEPVSDLEKLMIGSRMESEGIVITIPRNNKKEQFLFVPGADFSNTENAFFLTNNRQGFQYPLRNFTLTSNFGVRRNPVTGTIKNHDGLDLASPLGTEVFAAQSGIVTDIGNDSIYGNYIIIKHEGNWASLYGHLSKIEVGLRSTIQAGAVIGRVGTTGQSTGPHLHFELRQNGKAQDPGKYLFKEN
jgi:hypothetical protein